MAKSTYLHFMICILIGLTVCTSTPLPDEGAIKAAVRKVLNDQVRAWNAFDIEGFMEGYLKSDSLRFASGGTVHYGWQTTLQRYKNTYPDPSAMGELTFGDISVSVLSQKRAIVFGRYTLNRENDTPTGLFTLIFQKTDAGWKIIHDHTSAAQE